MIDTRTIEEFLDRNNKFAIVGVSSDPDKWGRKIYEKLKSIGLKVYPINPKNSKVNGDTCYPDLISLPEKPDVVIMVVPPSVTEKILEDCKAIGIDKVWMQPGSESNKAVNFCQDNRITVVANTCFVTNGLSEVFRDE